MAANIQGVGLGLRKQFQEKLLANPTNRVDFLEVAPENWMHLGGKKAHYFQNICQQYPIICHGLSLSIGGPAPLDTQFLKALKQFLDQHHIDIYSEHLSYCGDEGLLYDLMPIPFTQEAVDYVSGRISQVQDTLDRQITMENISYYATPSPEMTELEFINAVMVQSGCSLLLDVNNIYVNSVNQRYDAREFLKGLSPNAIAFAVFAFIATAFAFAVFAFIAAAFAFAVFAFITAALAFTAFAFAIFIHIMACEHVTLAQ